MGDRRLGLPAENAKTHPASGEILLYPGDVSEMEILVPYGQTTFGCKYGKLAGNHFATILDAGADWTDLGEHVWGHGAQDVTIDEV